jgi:hypothetical protein
MPRHVTRYDIPRIRAALAGPNGEVLRLVVAQPRKSPRHPPSGELIAVHRP